MKLSCCFSEKVVWRESSKICNFAHNINKNNVKIMMKRLAFAFFMTAAAVFQTGAQTPVEKPLALADPYILVEDGVYYAYGTTGDSGIEVFSSTDLENWERLGWALRKEQTSCPKWFWAPEVYNVNGRYLMYFSGNEKIRAAWSDSPTGPFNELYTGPLFVQEGNIDHHLYIDEDGKPYMFFVRFDRGNIIYSCELEPDFTTMKLNTLKQVARPEQEWEKLDAVVNEGPFIIKHNGTYYMTYSGNGYTCKDYAIGVATSESINGPWQKVDYNPILRRPNQLVGVGHHSFFRDAKGKLRIVFHAHSSDTKVHPRDTHIGYVSFKKNPNGGPDIISVDTESIIRCRLK